MTGETSRSVSELLNEGAELLCEAGIDGAQREARILLAHVLKCEAGDLIARGRDLVTACAASRFHAALAVRSTGKPVYRIIGARAFFGRQFSLNDACLEPRPETELLVERVLDDFSKDAGVRFCDVGTGSGVIAVSLLCEISNAFAVATDINGEALQAAQSNAVTHGVAERLMLTQADTLAGVEGLFEFVVSNPPYIPSGDIDELAREVRCHDPRTALDGGADGLENYRKLLEQSALVLRPGGRLYLETGHGQHDAICDMADKLGWGMISRHLDLSGLERIVVLEKQSNQPEGRLRLKS